MLTRESSAWGYRHAFGFEYWTIIARDTETGLYGYASLIRSDRTGEEDIVEFEPDSVLTEGIKTGEFDHTTHTWVD